MTRRLQVAAFLVLTSTIILSACERPKPAVAPPPAAPAKEKSSEEDVLDFLATLLYDPDFGREIEPIRHNLMFMAMARMTREHVEKLNREIATQWREKAGPIFWARVASSGVDIEAVESFLKGFVESAYPRQETIVEQIVERMTQELRPTAWNKLILGFLYQEIIRDRAFQIHLQNGFRGDAVTITVNGVIVYEGRPETNELLGIALAELIEVKAPSPTHMIELTAPKIGIHWRLQIDLYKGHAIGLDVYRGEIIMKQPEGFGYD